MPHDHHHLHEAKPHTSWRWAFFLNLFFACIELIGGFYTNSMAVISDAIHDFGDALSIGFAWYFEGKSYAKGSAEYSYGLRRLSTLSALVTGMILIVGSLVVIIQSVPRLLHPQSPNASGMLGLAIFGILVNSFAFFKMSKAHGLNEKMLRWHFIEDVLGWIIVLVTSVIMMFVDLPILDPLLAIGLSCWVLVNVFKNLRHVVQVFLQGAPDHISIKEIEKALHQNPLIEETHHSHLWTVDGEKHIFTSHIALKKSLHDHEAAKLKSEIKEMLSQKFHIFDATLELEGPSETCGDPTHPV